MVKCSFICFLSCIFFAGCSGNKQKFIKLEPENTHITFSNRITENDSINIFDFSNIYNGGGVGVGDFNNDGLQDLYFTGNMVPNELYLNKGNMQFENVTAKAKVNGNGIWSRGVAIVDINNDGKLDMYVCATAKRDPFKRTNILYVNEGPDKNGIPVFKDMAQEYGLADTTQSTMAYFFDYDNDGDLDVYIGVNHIIKDDYTNTFKKRNVNGEHPSTGKLYRNDWSDSLQHPVYVDVSRPAGILIEGYTHAADIFDANNDGWQDILVLNDYISSNILYINNHDGTFTDHAMEYFKHTAANSMGSDAIDINNDGLEDVIEVDMLPEDNYRKKMFQSPNNYFTYQNSDRFGYQYQYVRNMLQINQGATMGELDSIKHPVFSDAGFFSGIAETDWSWTPLVSDFDDDGQRDIMFTNGFPNDITDHDFVAFRKMASDLVTKKEMLAEIPIIKIHNYIYKNEGKLKFTDKTTEWGLEEPSFSNGAVYADLDNDGDLDMVINNINDSATLYENKINPAGAGRSLNIKFIGSSKNVNGIGAKVILHQKNNTQTFVNNPYRGYISSVTPIMHFGLGADSIVDSIEIFWPGNVKQVLKQIKAALMITVNIRNASIMPPISKPVIDSANWFTNVTRQAGINYIHRQRDFIDFNIQKLLPHKFSEYAPALAAGDINGDGLDDFVTGGSFGNSAMVFTQNAAGKFSQSMLLQAKDTLDKQTDDRGVLLFDADGDGDLDLYISSGGYGMAPNTSAYQDRFYVNDGHGNFQQDSSVLPPNYTSKFCVRAADFDKDGDLDLFIAGRVNPWNYPQPVSSFIYRNDTKQGKIKFTDVSSLVAPALSNIGLTCDALWTDFDNDGWPDLLLAGEWMPLKFLKNDKGHFKDITSSTGISDKPGWWNSISSGDFDNDGDIDYVVGNLGQNSFYKGDKQYPLSIYAKDFDHNGVLECVTTKYIKDKPGGALKEFPTHTRDDVTDQMPFLKRKFLTYKSFAAATIDQLFTEDERKGMLKFTLNYLSSSFLRNNGKGTFSLEPLPDIAQYSVINGMVADDFDGDGNLDICLNTNDYGTEPGNGRYDALNGLVLKGDGKGRFMPLSILKSGIYIPGDGKALIKVKGAERQYYMIASQNKGPLQVYQIKHPVAIVSFNADDSYALVTKDDGSKQKIENYFGNSFLSQSGRFFSTGNKVKSVTITNNDGKSRIIF